MKVIFISFRRWLTLQNIAGVAWAHFILKIVDRSDLYDRTDLIWCQEFKGEGTFAREIRKAKINQRKILPMFWSGK